MLHSSTLSESMLRKAQLNCNVQKLFCQVGESVPFTSLESRKLLFTKQWLASTSHIKLSVSTFQTGQGAQIGHTHFKLLFRLFKSLPVKSINDEDNGIYCWEVVLPHPPSCLMTSKVKGCESNAPYWHLLFSYRVMKYSYNYIMSVSIPVMRLTQSAPIVRVPVEKYLYVQEIAVILRSH